MTPDPDQYAPVGLKLDAAGRILGPLAFLGIFGASGNIAGTGVNLRVPGTQQNVAIPFSGQVLIVAQFNIQCFQGATDDTQVNGSIVDGLGNLYPNQLEASLRFGTFTGAGSQFVSQGTVHAMAVQFANQGDTLNIGLAVQDIYNAGAKPSTTFLGTGWMAFLLSV